MRHYKRQDTMIREAQGAIGYARLRGEQDNVEYDFYGAPRQMLDDVFGTMKKCGLIDGYELVVSRNPRHLGRIGVVTHGLNFQMASMPVILDMADRLIRRSAAGRPVRFYKDHNRFMSL